MHTNSMRPNFLAVAICLMALATISTSQAAPAFETLRHGPDSVSAVTETGTLELKPASKTTWAAEDLILSTASAHDGLQIQLTAPHSAVKHLRLRWQQKATADSKYLGDALERAYGDLEWKVLDTNRVMPWYFLMTDGNRTDGVGVKTGPAALCYWKVDAEGLTLEADVRSGGVGVQLGNRTLSVCTVVSRMGLKNESGFEAAQAFCREMCPKPRMPAQPVYGFNDWYCAYGNNTAEKYLQDATYITSLAPTGGNRPFAVVDGGWAANELQDVAGPGPWDRANPRFGSTMTMDELAKKLHAVGARPGIWVRPLLANPEHPKNWRLSRDSKYLDPTIPEVKAYVRETMSHLSGWGYELIKHDFSTYDISGRWGFEMRDGFTPDGWAFADRSHTTAEVILEFYKDIRKGAGNKTLVLGCNVIGHLSAGLFELQRIGDDTSGNEWDRTRKMGVNCLAFRGAQHGTFFAVDGDCAGQVSTNSVPWEKNRQWLDLLARSGTPLFVSFPRAIVNPEQEAALRAAFATASKPQPVAHPLNWLEQRTPTRWEIGGREVDYTW